MTRYKLAIEYDGSQYKGWQILHNEPTIQGKLIEICSKICKTNTIEVYGAGRTDAGVHALGQVAHVDADTNIPPNEFHNQLQAFLPSNISVKTVEIAHNRFHARHHATYRSYLYCITKERTALFKRYVWWIKNSLNVEQMNIAAQEFKGFHNFKSFGKSSKNEESTMVEISHIHIYEVQNCIWIHIVGSHFLWSMVRRMVGTLAEVGKGTLQPNDIKTFLQESSDFPARHTAPPSGLFLEQVYYSKHIDIQKPQFPFII